MTTLSYKGRLLPAEHGESVLDCLNRNHIPVRSSCRAGVCQSCLVRGAAPPPLSAQKGISSSLADRHFFLACQCPVEESPGLVEEDEFPVSISRVRMVERLGPDIFQVLLERPPELTLRSGQFLHLTRRADGLTRSYSIASRADDPLIELHVARIAGGEMSNYLTSEPGALLELRGPVGECVYSGASKEPLLLVGTGTGIAPLLGVVRTALYEGHKGPISLFHGASRTDRLYMRDELRSLERQHPNFHYEEDVLDSKTESRTCEHEDQNHSSGLAARVRERHPSLKDHRIYLCGNPDLVHALKRQCFLAGAAIRSIHSDPFVPSRSAGPYRTVP